MAQVGVTYFRRLDMLFPNARVRTLLRAVAIHLYGKDMTTLDPREISIITHRAGRGSKSGYRAEVVITLDCEDFPFPIELSSEIAARMACRSLARKIWKDIHLKEPLLVWVLAGNATGYYDGPQPD